MANNEGKTLDNKCPACNASLEYNAQKGKWKCEYCGVEYTLEDLKKYTNASSDKVNDGEKGDDTSYDLYRCPDCGAEIVADENTASTFCVYCGNSAILKNKLSGRFAPNYIIPFTKTKEDAVEAFKKVTKGKPFTPSTFITNANIEKIRGIYIPFWLYNIMLVGKANISATRSTSWTKGDTHYTKTDYYNVVRGGSMKFNRIPVDGSSRFDDALMNTIEPFDYSGLKEYNHAYLSGFLAEKYDVDKDASFAPAKERAISTADEQFLATCTGYTTKVISSRDYTPSEESCEYVLLPVYMVNVKYNDKYYTFAMNGQTGEFVGNVPVSFKKALLKTVIVFVIAFIIALIASYLFFNMGGN